MLHGYPYQGASLTQGLFYYFPCQSGYLCTFPIPHFTKRNRTIKKKHLAIGYELDKHIWKKDEERPPIILKVYTSSMF